MVFIWLSEEFNKESDSWALRQVTVEEPIDKVILASRKRLRAPTKEAEIELKKVPSTCTVK